MWCRTFGVFDETGRLRVLTSSRHKIQALAERELERGARRIDVTTIMRGAVDVGPHGERMTWLPQKLVLTLRPRRGSRG